MTPSGPLFRASIAAALSLCGCVASTHSAAFYDGYLDITWTIDSAADPGACLAFGAAELYVSVADSRGAWWGDYAAACSTLGITIRLPPGAYSASAFLADSAGQPRTTTVAISGFRIYANGTLSIPIDFPATSFY